MPHDPAYLLAEKKIEEARKSNVTKLDLSDMQLTELPESIGRLTQLQELNLGASHKVDLESIAGKKVEKKTNQLTTLPETFGQLTQLQSLDLSNNHLTELPDTLRQLSQLRILIAYDNQLTTIHDWISQLTNLVV